MHARGRPLGVAPLELLSLVLPFVWGRPAIILDIVILFHSFHAVIKVQFGGLARLDWAVNNYKDNLNSLYRDPDLTLTIDRALRNIIVSAYSHYIDSWPMNGACVGYNAVLIRSMLQFTMHYGRYWCRQCHFIRECRRKGLSASTPLRAIDLAALLKDEEENHKLEQVNVMYISIMELLGDPGNPLYTKPHSMAEHFDAMLAGARAIGDLPGQTCCRDSGVTARIHDNEAKQVWQKILRCLDMRVMAGDLIVLIRLLMPTLILPTRCFVQMLYNPDAQGQYTSKFPTGGQGFLQPRGDIRTSIMLRNFWVLPTDVRDVIDQYFHREELERKADLDEEEYMSTDTEAAQTVWWLQLHCSTATVSLQEAMHEALMPAAATRLQEQEYNYDSDDSVLDLDEEYPNLAEWVVQWQATWQGTASAPPWQPSGFGQQERSYFDKLPDLRDLLN